MQTTTDLEAIRKTPLRFTWGTITKFHEVGPYTLVEYMDRLNRDETAFHIYVDGKCTSTSAATLEGAIVLAIARKHLEANEARYMAKASIKLLGVKEETPT